MNEYSENRRNPPFFEFGTPPATFLASGANSSSNRNTKENTTMFIASESAARAFAAVSALAISAVFMATAIIPATPAGILA